MGEDSRGARGEVSTETTMTEVTAEQPATEQTTKPAVVSGVPCLEGLRVATEVTAVASLHGVIVLLGTEHRVSGLAHNRAARAIVNRHGRCSADDRSRAGVDRAGNAVVTSAVQCDSENSFENH